MSHKLSCRRQPWCDHIHRIHLTSRISFSLYVINTIRSEILEKNSTPFRIAFAWSLVISFGWRFDIHVSHAWNNQRNVPVCSSDNKAHPSNTDWPWWLSLTKQTKDMPYLFINYVVSKVMSSWKESHCSTSCIKPKIWSVGLHFDTTDTQLRHHHCQALTFLFSLENCNIFSHQKLGCMTNSCHNKRFDILV